MSRLPHKMRVHRTETTEVLYLLGDQECITGISGFTIHPPQARRFTLLG
jgi:iron complex transport system substrate-binding protein